MSILCCILGFIFGGLNWYLGYRFGYTKGEKSWELASFAWFEPRIGTSDEWDHVDVSVTRRSLRVYRNGIRIKTKGTI